MPDSPEKDDPKQRLADLVQQRGWRVACAESVTAGLVADKLAQAPSASDWFLGGVVAYTSEVKQRLLDVAPGPVVNPETAAQMARGVARLLDAQATVATTGVGGPDAQEGQPAGTVWVGLFVDGEVETHELHVDGDPEDVCTGAAERAVAMLAERLGGSG
ncbi:MAG TPA: CinA family protein [Mycobacteriales bacterium]|nr:CinA family protein [Mycobacteriales bacterium]